MVSHFAIQIQPKTYKRYVDDSHACFTSRHHANTFQELLNKQDPAIQYTIEYENGNKSLNFLDINIALLTPLTTNMNSKRTEKKSHYQHIYQINIVHRP